MSLCFECQKPSNELHHVIPKSRGGTKTVPLCYSCHDKVHDRKVNRTIPFGELIRAGMKRAKQNGKCIGQPVKYAPQVIEIMLSLHSKAKPMREIGRILGIPYTTVREIIKRESCKLAK